MAKRMQIWQPIAARSLVGIRKGEWSMPQGDKDEYTDKQKRKAEHIEEGYEDRGVSKKEAEAARVGDGRTRRDGGGNKSGSGRGKTDTRVSSAQGRPQVRVGTIGRRALRRRPRKGWETRRRNGAA